MISITNYGFDCLALVVVLFIPAFCFERVHRIHHLGSRHVVPVCVQPVQHAFHNTLGYTGITLLLARRFRNNLHFNLRRSYIFPVNCMHTINPLTGDKFNLSSVVFRANTMGVRVVYLAICSFRGVPRTPCLFQACISFKCVCL